MTEAEWLVSKSPERMLRYLQRRYTSYPGMDVKLLQFIAACQELQPACDSWGNTREYTSDWLWEIACSWSITAGTYRDSPTLETRAHLVREIFGNVFRPIELPSICTHCGSDSQEPEVDYACCGKCGQTSFDCPWVTTTVLSMIEEIYQNRLMQTCRACRGTKREWETGAGFEYEVTCGACNGSGHQEDVTLDPQRLLILADALEEAGCTYEKILRHLRGEEPKPNLHLQYGTGPVVPLARQPIAYPHVRGCHVIELLRDVSIWGSSRAKVPEM